MTNKYFKSEDVQVYPCGYRGNKTNEATVYNPQARMTTEEGLTRLGSLGDLSRSYVVSFEDNILRLILGGYFFRISNLDNYSDLTNAYLYIKLKEASIVESGAANNKTQILSSLYPNAVDKLDAYIDGEDRFVGLAYSLDEPDSGCISLKVFANGTSDNELVVEKAAKLPLYDASTGAFKIGIDDNTASGARSFAIGNATAATGENSVTCGQSTQASGKNSVSGGQNSNASGDNAIAFGNNVTASEKNSAAFGNNTTASANDQFIIGKYNESNSDDIFEVGVGEDSSNRKNAFAVKKDEIDNNVHKVTFGESYIDQNHLHTKQITATGDVTFGKKTVGDRATGIFVVSTDGIVANNPLTLNANLSVENNTITSANIETGTLSAKSKTALADGCATFETDKITFNKQTQINNSLTVAQDILTQQSLEVYNTAKLGQNGTIATFTPNTIQLKQPTTISNNLTISEGYDLTITDSDKKSRNLKDVVSKLDKLSSDLVESLDTKNLTITGKITANALEMTDLNASITLGDPAQTSTEAGNTLLKVYGKVEANRYSARSDIRLKENLREYTPKKSILDLPVYEYDYKNGDKNVIGCTAQDLREICPEIVSENSDGYLVIEESKITYLLLQEVKKLREEVEALKKRGN